jgi:hypothetical protein
MVTNSIATYNIHSNNGLYKAEMNICLYFYEFASGLFFEFATRIKNVCFAFFRTFIRI